MTKVKICGVTNKDDAVWALNYGADYIGINFWKESKRHMSIKTAASLAAELPSFATLVGVFVNPVVEDVVRAVKEAKLKGVQLHGNETLSDVVALRVALNGAGFNPFIIKALRIENAVSLTQAQQFVDAVDYFLLDAYVTGEQGGTGQQFDWNLLKGVTLPKPFFLAGGLVPGNVKEAVKLVGPFGVDVASGVENGPRKKSAEKMRDFIQYAKK
ncbi:MAG: phosphoribosylanthranilate isomerase [Bdellovibrionales bacterium]|nr:phosphoribosylanthranilate isomerase [Bdellovibrionales bacterium]